MLSQSRSRFLLLTFFTLAALSTCAAQPSWKQTAANLINSGELARAELILSRIGGDERRRHIVEIDSLTDIAQRIRKEFSIPDSIGRLQIKGLIPSASDSLIDCWINTKKIETMTIDGKCWWFNRSIRNFKLLCNEIFGQTNDSTRSSECQRLQSYANNAIQSSPDDNLARNWHRVSITFSIDVDSFAAPDGEILRVWMPFPIQSNRQRNVTLTSTSHKPILSQNSIHSTIYMEAKAERVKNTHFEATYNYEVAAQIFNRDSIISHLEPYDTTSETYQKFTATVDPNIVTNDQIRSIADSLTIGIDNPVLKASAIYDWITANLPWASARDYSTIQCIPLYVLQEHHGDCGQVALLYISLLRSIGIPARWESGWMLHPGAKNLHDWCEVYFEGTGWVPCDVSMGRTTRGSDIADYYKTSTDIYRLAANTGIGGQFDPPKHWIRSDAVDSQCGEVEWIGGNIPSNLWHYSLSINSFEPCY